MGRAITDDPILATGNVNSGIKLLGATSSSTPGDGFGLMANAKNLVGIFNRNSSNTSTISYADRYNGRILEYKYNASVIGSVATDVTNLVLKADNDLILDVGGGDRFRIGSSGQFGIGGATYGTAGYVLTSGGASAAPTWSSPVPPATFPMSSVAFPITGTFSGGGYTYRKTNQTGYGVHHFYSNFGGTGILKAYVMANGNYASVSDYRLKENISEITNGLSIINQLKPSTFNWIGDTSTQTNYGFIAHEVQEVLPDIVNGTKDGEDYQNMSQMSIISTLTAAVKELSSKNDALEARIAALEG